MSQRHRAGRARAYPFAAVSVLGAVALVATALGLAAQPVAGIPVADEARYLGDSLSAAGSLHPWGIPGGEPDAAGASAAAPPLPGQPDLQDEPAQAGRPAPQPGQR